jgi:hypothetical protein
MHIPKRSPRYINAIFAILVLLLGGGCATVNPNVYTNMMAYEPARSKTRIDTDVVLRVSHTLTPEMRAKWKQWLSNDQSIDNYRQAAVNVIAHDIVQSGLFTRVEPSMPAPDFIVQIWSEERMSPQPTLALRVEVLNSAQQVISTHTREGRLGTTLKDYNLKLVLPKLMAALKADMMTDLLAYIHQRQQQAEQAQAAVFEKAALPELLTAADRSVNLARERNRAIIAAKNQQLSGILRDKKTDELSALVVKIEQTILDLNHESEVAKDRAQQTTATNGDARQLEELRGLTISYRERIELLKPILTALKEEIANRNR